MKKASALFTIFCLLLLFITGCSQSQQTSSTQPSAAASNAEASTSGADASTTPKAQVVKLIAAHVQTVPDAAFTQSMHLFADRVSEISDGQMNIEVHDGTLGTNETEIIDKLVMGAVDITVASPGFMSKLGVPEVDMFSLPYLIESTDHFGRVFSGEVGKDFADIVYEKTNQDFKVIGYWSAGIRSYYGKKPVNSPDDLKGVKIRTQSAPVQLEFWKSCGAIPTTVAFAEMYQALQQGVIDAAENDPLTVYQNEHHKTENGKYISETGHDISPRLFMIKGKVWEGLSAEQQGWIQAAADEASAHNIQYNIDMAQEARQKIAEDGAVINEVDIAPFVEIAIGIQDEFAAEQSFENWLEKIRAAR